MSIKLNLSQLPPEVARAALLGLLRVLSAHKTYTLDLTDIVEGAIPGEDLFTGWSLVTRLGPQLAIATILSSRKGKVFFSGVSAGPEIAAALQAADDIERQEDARLDGDYEVAFLGIPGLQTDGLWLRSQTGGKDWIVPYTSLMPELKANTPYSLEEFLEIVRPVAKQGLADFQALLLDFPPG